jgi:PilZ domain
VGEYRRTTLFPSAAGRTERRLTPRVRVQHRVPGSFTTSSAPVLIRNISLGGVLVESAEPFHVGAVHQFRIGTDETEPASPPLAAETIYCHDQSAPDGDFRFFTGFRFLRHQEEIGELVIGNW